VPYLRVVGECDCGCGSEALEDSRGAEEWDRQDEFADAVNMEDRSTLHVLVDLDTMVPASLEVYGGERPHRAGLPEVGLLTLMPPEDD
jgi:hypothetical protein